MWEMTINIWPEVFLSITTTGNVFTTRQVLPLVTRPVLDFIMILEFAESSKSHLEKTLFGQFFSEKLNQEETCMTVTPLVSANVK